MKAFRTKIIAGVKFLVILSGRSVHVIDENGNNYGTWYTFKEFMAAQKKNEVNSIGQVKLSVWNI